MKNHDEILLDRYFAGALSDAEKSAFLKQLESDPELAEDFRWRKQVAEAFRLKEDRRLKALLQAEDKALIAPPTKSVPINFYRIASIAAALLALVAAWWFIRPAIFTPADRVAIEFSGIKTPETFRAAAPEPDSLEKIALKAYDKQQYSLAASTLQQLIARQPDVLSYQFYLAVSLVGDAQYEKAIPLLEKLCSNEENEEFQVNAYWYLALAQYFQGDKAAARKTLGIYLQQEAYVAHREEAEKILQVEIGR